MTKPITWSYSNLSLYQQCPKKYFHLRIAKDVKEESSDALTFGNEIHKIAQDFTVDFPWNIDANHRMDAQDERLRGRPDGVL